MRNKGFSFVQIIVAITILSGFLGFGGPFGVRFAQQTYRMRDVREANDIAYQFQLMMSYYGGLPVEALDEDKDGANVISWQKQDVLQATGLTEEQLVEAWTGEENNGQDYLRNMFFYYLDEIPESSTDKDYIWNLHYNTQNGSVEKIVFVEMEASGDVISEMEVYPNYAKFVALQ